MFILKRNGEKVLYDVDKIRIALKKAFKQVGATYDEDVLLLVDSKIKEFSTVEDIQDIVVETLFSKGFSVVGLAYQSYRAVRTDFRRKNSTIHKEVEGLLDASSLLHNENANKDGRVLTVTRDRMAGIVSKDMYLNGVLPKKFVEAHNVGEIHLHDLDYVIERRTNCGNYNLGKMLRGGCVIGNADMAEPNGVDVAVGHTVQLIASLASNTYGGCTIPYIDRDLTPYVRKTFVKHFNNGLKYVEKVDKKVTIPNSKYFIYSWDEIYGRFEKKYPQAYKYAKDLTIESVKQAVQGMEYEINSLSTNSGQTPFTTIGFGTETTWEGRLIQEHIFRTRMGGFGKHKKEVAIFPKLVFATCDEINLNENSPNHDIMLIAMECMTKSVYPDILFVSKETVDRQEVLYPMGCRAFLGDVYDEHGFKIVNNRFNMGAVSINLPRIAIKNRGDEVGFYKELERILDLCKEHNEFRVKYMEDLPSDISPILWQTGALTELPKDTKVENVWRNGYSTISIGFIGLSEVSELLYGVNFAHSPEVHDKCVQIMQFMKDKIDSYKKETGIGFAFYATPSESLCKRFEEMDLAEFGVIDGITDKGYYDNSFHVSSRININPLLKLKLEAPFHSIVSGGHISYIESDSLKNNLGAILDILKYSKNIGIHYMGINQPVDRCFDCDFEGEFKATELGFECPNCGNKDPKRINVIRRVCGYLSQPNDRPYNVGKQKEVIARVKHK